MSPGIEGPTHIGSRARRSSLARATAREPPLVANVASTSVCWSQRIPLLPKRLESVVPSLTLDICPPRPMHVADGGATKEPITALIQKACGMNHDQPAVDRLPSCGFAEKTLSLLYIQWHAGREERGREGRVLLT